MYEVIPEFENTFFVIENQSFELYENEGKETGMGFAEGTIRYDAIFRDGERKKLMVLLKYISHWNGIAGPFVFSISQDIICTRKKKINLIPKQFFQVFLSRLEQSFFYQKPF